MNGPTFLAVKFIGPINSLEQPGYLHYYHNQNGNASGESVPFGEVRCSYQAVLEQENK